jgi:hypothetical protein
MENDTNSTNPVAILAAQFSSMERTKIKVKGLPTYYAKPLNFEQKIKLSEIHGMSDSRKKSRAMCAVIVNHVIDEDGKRAFLSHNNMTAAEALAVSCDPDVVTEIFTQTVGVDLGDDDEVEEVVGKSEEQDSVL